MQSHYADIPSFALYGDSEYPDAAALMHIETIATRSALHDWEIGLHRHRQGVQILVVQKGHAIAQLEARSLPLDGPCYLCIPQGAVHGFSFEPGTAGYVVTLAADFVTRASGSDPLLALLTAGGHAPLPRPSIERVCRLARELLRLQRSWPFDRRLAGCLFEALLRSLPLEPAELQLDPRLTQFRQSLERHLIEHRPVSFYAEQVGLSARQLARLSVRHFGCSPQATINRRLAAEAQRMLRYSNASVVQTSDALGFGDPSYFSRFYLRETGHRPVEEKRATKKG